MARGSRILPPAALPFWPNRSGLEPRPRRIILLEDDRDHCDEGRLVAGANMLKVLNGGMRLPDGVAIADDPAEDGIDLSASASD